MLVFSLAWLSTVPVPPEGFHATGVLTLRLPCDFVLLLRPRPGNKKPGTRAQSTKPGRCCSVGVAAAACAGNLILAVAVVKNESFIRPELQCCPCHHRYFILSFATNISDTAIMRTGFSTRREPFSPSVSAPARTWVLPESFHPVPAPSLKLYIWKS